jgi:hypothetical protein
MIYIKSKKAKQETLSKKYPTALILDVSSKGEQPWVRLSPFYPHGGIPIPPYPTGYKLMSAENISKYFSQTVEGIWQGLKVFEGEDIDRSKFEIKNMEGIKRSVRKFGNPKGHRNGVNGKELLDYPTARKEIYLRVYAWMLDNKVNDIVLQLKDLAEKQDIILLDYNTNENIEDYSKPLSHAGLVKRYLIKKHPALATLVFEQPKTVKKKDKSKKMASKSTKSTTKKEKIDNQSELFNSLTSK